MTLRAFRHRNFQLFFSGQLISLIGTWMQTVAQAWLVYRMTKSALLLGSVGFASQIPVFLIAPFGGITADRVNRQRLVIATQTAAMILAGILAWLTLSGRVHVWHIFVLAAMLGVVNAFDIPGRQSFIVDMVGKEDLMNAIALNSSMFNGARVIGPAIAGILVAKIGEGWCFAANSISYIAVIVGLSLMHVCCAPRASQHSPMEDIIEGFRWVNHTKVIRALLLLLGLVSLVGMPYVVLMPVFADKILHGGARGLGILMGATGVGAMFGALTLAAKTGIKRARAVGGVRLRKLWYQSLLFFILDSFLVVSCASVARRLLDDVADGLLKHADPNHGSRPAARPRHVRLLHDVHGHGALRSLLRRSLGAPHRRPHHGRHGRSSLRPRRDFVRTRPPRPPHRRPPPNHRPRHGRRRTRSRTQRAAGGRVDKWSDGRPRPSPRSVRWMRIFINGFFAGPRLRIRVCPQAYRKPLKVVSASQPAEKL